MKDIAFGQYYPATSFVHKMDARIKILVVITYIVAVFLVRQFQFMGFALCLTFVLVSTICSKVPFTKMLKSIKAILFFIFLSAILQIFFNNTGKIVFSWKFIKITDMGLLNAGFLITRITLVVLGASLLTFTTSPVELADGIESLLSPLKIIRFPVHEFALIMSIALKFIPTLLEETDRIVKAQKARGADFDSGNIIKKAKALIPVLIPLLISAFKKAEELGDAMDSRCYSGSKTRTKYRKLKMTWRDLIAFSFTVLTVAGIVFTNTIGVIV